MQSGMIEQGDRVWGAYSNDHASAVPQCLGLSPNSHAPRAPKTSLSASATLQTLYKTSAFCMSITFNSQPAIQSSPASEHSVYFDAPLMHFFTKKRDSGDDLATGNDSTQDPVGSVRLQDRPQDSDEEVSNLNRQRSVTIPADLVVAESGDYATEEVPDGQRAAPIQKTSRGTSMSPPPDSGYGSSPPSAERADDAPRSPSRNTRRNANIQAVPIVGGSIFWQQRATSIVHALRSLFSGSRDDA